MFKKLLLVLALLPAQVFGHITYVTIMENEATAQTIVFFGDRHTSHTDVPKQDKFFAQLHSTLNKDLNHKNVEFFYENVMEKPFSSSFQSKIELEQFLISNGFHPDSFSYDPVTQKGISKKLEDRIFTKEPNERNISIVGEAHIKLYYKDPHRLFKSTNFDPRTQKKLEQINNLKNNPTGRALLQSLETTWTRLAKDFPSLYKTTIISDRLKALHLHKAETTIIDGKNFLKIFNCNNYDQLMITVQRKNPELISTFLAAEGVHMYTIIADLTLLKLIQDSEKKLLFVYAGRDHVITLVKFLEFFGWKQFFTTDPSKDITDPDKWESEVFQACNKHLENPIIQMSCDSCAQVKLLTKMKKCGACKIVHYCSKECQKAHWKAGHKNECKKITVAGTAAKIATSKID